MARNNFGGGAQSSLFSSLFSSSQAAANQAQEKENSGKIQKWDYDFQGNRITGRAYAANLRNIAQQYKDSDPQRYYQLLEQAQTLEAKSPGFYKSSGSGSGGSGGGGGRGGGSSPRVQANNTAKSTYTQNTSNYKAATAYYKFFEDAYDKGQTTVIDPSTGKSVVLNESVMSQIDAAYNQALVGLQKTYDKGYAVIGADGKATMKTNHDEAMKVGVQRSEFTGKVYKRNGADMTNAQRDQLNALIDVTNSASKSSDPLAASRAVKQAADNYAQWVKSNLMSSKGSVTTKNGGQDVAAGTHATETQRSALEGGVDPGSDIAKQATALSDFMQLAASPNVTPEQLQAAHASLVSAYGGTLPAAVNTMLNGDGKGNLGYGQAVNLADGVTPKIDANGNITGAGLTQYIDQAGHVQYAKNVPSIGPVPNGDGTFHQGTVQQPDIKLGAGQHIEVIYIPDANGNPVATNIVASKTDAGLKVWTATQTINQNGVSVKAGDTLTPDQISALKSDGLWDNEVGGGSLKQTSAGNFEVATAPNGETYYRDGSSGAWFRGGLPVSYKSNGDGTIVAGSLTWPPNADVGGTPFISTVPFERMQAVVNSGQLDPRAAAAIQNETGRDSTGAQSPTATYPASAAFAHPVTDPSGRDSWYNDDGNGPDAVNKAIEDYQNSLALQASMNNPYHVGNMNDTGNPSSLQNSHDHGFDMSPGASLAPAPNLTPQVAGQDIAKGGTLAALSKAFGVSGPTGARPGVPVNPKAPKSSLPSQPGLTSLTNSGDVVLPGAGRQAGARVTAAPVAPPPLPKLPDDLGAPTLSNDQQDIVKGGSSNHAQQAPAKPQSVTSMYGGKNTGGGKVAV